MRYLLIVTIGLCLLTLSACDNGLSFASDATTVNGADTAANQRTVEPRTLLSPADAGKILGAPVVLQDSSYKSEAQAIIYKSTYAAVGSDRRGKRRRAVYFLFEEYPKADTAHEVYARIKAANEHHEGVETLHGVGDEAYFHSDGKNFYYIMVRKGRRGFRIKASGISGAASPDEFNEIARRIASQL